MTKRFEKAYDTVMALPKKERALLAEQLLGTLSDRDRAEIERAEVDRAWIEEVERRFKEVDEGRVKTIPAKKVIRELKARLRK